MRAALEQGGFVSATTTVKVQVFVIALLLACLFFLGLRMQAGSNQPVSAHFERIDAHVHVFNLSSAFERMMRRQNVRMLNICVVDKHDRGFEQAAPQIATAIKIFGLSSGRAAWCSTFDPENWDSPGFANRAIAEINRTFRDGAVAVKIYKNIGMELKSHDGSYVMPDDPVFDPILEFIAKQNRTLYAHIAEPDSSWKALDPSSPDYGYYSQKENQAWYMYLHPERPSKERILTARDRMLAKHPTLRVVGCHLGSMETDVDEIAKRFDRYPNFAVDTAARVSYLILQPREKVRAFLLKYQNRVLYGTDLDLLPWSNPEKTLKHWEAEYARDWKFFATDEIVEYKGRQFRGLALPEPVLRKIFRNNAIDWVPGILQGPALGVIR